MAGSCCHRHNWLAVASLLACWPTALPMGHSQLHHVAADPGHQQHHQMMMQHEHSSMSHEHSSMSHEQHQSQLPNTHPLIVVLLDGMRHDYLEIYRRRGLNLSNFESLLRQGVQATNVTGVYPTETLPNHQSLMTGLYPKDHGIVFNSFVDSNRPGKVFSMEDQASLNDPEWYRGWPEPLWITNQRQGGRSAVLLYPNADVPYGGMRPFLQVDQYISQNERTIYPHELRVDRLLQWLSCPQLYGPVNLALLYFDEPDAAAHRHGPVSDAVAAKLLELDRQLGRLMDGLMKLGMLDSINLVVTSDHGMAATDPKEVIELSSVLPPGSYVNLLGSQLGVHAHLAPVPGQSPAQLVGRVRAAKIPGLRAFEVSQLPAEMKLSGCPSRLPPVLLLADPPRFIRLNASFPDSALPRGVHGYLAAASPHMRPLWLARGPAFRSGGAEFNGSAESLDLYPLACSLLGLAPGPNNGSLDRLAAGVLAAWPPAPSLASGGGVVGGFFANFAGLLVLAGLFGCILLAVAMATSRRTRRRGGVVRGDLQ